MYSVCSKNLLLIYFLLVSGSTAAAQQTGGLAITVLSHLTKQAVIGASFNIKGTLYGGAADSVGHALVDHIPEGSYAVIISMIGYQQKLIPEVNIVAGKVTEIEADLVDDGLLNEVRIKAIRGENNLLTPVSSYTFSREEIFRSPGAQGDIFRVIGILPGVTSSGGQFSAISVRGQGVRDNVYMVDDIPVQEVSHLEGTGSFNDPYGGRFSIFAPRTIQSATFQGGGFPAAFGRKGSAYLGLDIKEGNRETPSFSGQFDLLGATLIYDGPSYAAKNTSVFATARYQNFYLLEKVAGLKNIGLPAYGDYMVKTVTQINSNNKLEVLAMYNPERYTKDVADIKQSEKPEELSIVSLSNNKSLFGLNLRTLTGKSSYWKNVLYYRTLNSSGSFGTATPAISADGGFADKDHIAFVAGKMSVENVQHELGYRSFFTHHVNGLTVVTGIDLSNTHMAYNRNLRHTDTLYTYAVNDTRLTAPQKYIILQPQYYNSVFNRTAFNASAYIDLSFALLKRLTINPGLRYDHTGFSDQQTLSPRLSGSLALNPGTSLNFAAGVFYQDPLLTDVADQPSPHKLKTERTTQYILGYKNYFSEDFKLVVETWYKQFDQLVTRQFSGESLLNNNGTGYAYGADFNLTKRLSENFYGQAGYSYMQSKRDDHDGLDLYNFTYSQPHIVSLLASYKPAHKWIFSGKFRFATGRPKNTFVVYDNVFNTPGLLRYSQEITGKNVNRLNNFISLDIRADYKTKLKNAGISVFLDIDNLLNRFNQAAENFQPLTGKTYYDGLGIFPSFGLRIEI